LLRGSYTRCGAWVTCRQALRPRWSPRGGCRGQQAVLRGRACAARLEAVYHGPV